LAPVSSSRRCGSPWWVEHRLDALLPLPALIDQRVTQPHPGAQIEQVVGRDPRLGQTPDHQQLTQMPSVGAIGLGPPLGPAEHRSLGRLGEMHVSSDRAQLLDDEPPARRRLQRHLEPPAGEPRQVAPHLLAVRRRDTRAPDLAAVGVQPIRGDLCPVLIQSHYDRHHGASSSSTEKYLRASCAPELGRPQLRRDHAPAHAIFRVVGVAGRSPSPR
jgi:hypothetical protein